MSPTSPEQRRLMDAVRAYVAAFYAPLRAVRLRVVLDDGEEIRLPMPACAGEPAPPPPPEPRPDDERDCRADILAVLVEADRRLTTMQILSELERRQWVWGERTVQGHLARMVQDGDLENDPRARPPGYRNTAERPQ